MSVIDGFWIGSTDDIYKGNDRTKTLTDHLNSTIQSANTQLNATASNGSFSLTSTVNLVDNARYLVSLQYLTSTGLVGKSLYALKVNKASALQQTIMLAEPKNGTDNLMVMYRNGSFIFSTSYTGGSPTNVTINII